MLFSVDIDLATEEWGVFRVNNKLQKSQEVRMFIEDIGLYINVKVLGGTIPRNPNPKITIPFQSAEAFDWILTKDALATTSGQFRLQNNPTKAVIFLIRGDADGQFANPFDLQDNDCSEIELDLNGKRHTMNVSKSVSTGDDADLYYETFRALGPTIPIGKWFMEERYLMFQGMFVVAFDLTKSGLINQLDTLDMDIVR